MSIDLHIERWPVEQLIPRITNPRTHTQAQVSQIAGSIREFGWTNPILVGAENDIIAGHARLMAARQLGMDQVPVIGRFRKHHCVSLARVSGGADFNPSEHLSPYGRDC